jgi:hypothetical protein
MFDQTSIDPSELIQLTVKRSNVRSNIRLIKHLFNPNKISLIDRDKIKYLIKHPIDPSELVRLIVIGSNVRSNTQSILVN